MLLLPEGADDEVALPLLGKLAEDAVKAGVCKVFLRLRKESPLLPVARKAGFTHYVTEILCRSPAEATPGPAPATPAALSIREKSRSDEHTLFQLYNAAVPDPVRQAEAMTFQEWHDTRERSSTLHRRREFLCEKEGRAIGWLGTIVEGHAAQFSIMAHPSEEDTAATLVHYALTLLENKSPVYALVPDYQAGLRRILEGHRFQETAAFSTQVKQLAVRLRRPSLAPFQV